MQTAAISKRRRPMEPVAPEVVAELMFSWYVWGTLFVFTAIFTVVGTYLVTRRWQE
jgi:hypothetical protein